MAEGSGAGEKVRHRMRRYELLFVALFYATLWAMTA